MKIEKCTVDIKCDANGCHEKAKVGLSFDGVSPQTYLCEKCAKKLYEALNIRYKGEKNGRQK